jgi:ubiquinone/menaquinone biosynthesis C-methylase UbiE
MNAMSMKKHWVEVSELATEYDLRWYLSGFVGIQTWFTQYFWLPRAHRLILKALEDVEFQDLLDIGCGLGQWSTLLADKRKPRLGVGIDLVPAMAKLAKERSRYLGLTNINYCASSATSLSFPRETFDLAIAIYVFQHIIDDAFWRLAVSEMVKIVRPGSYLFTCDNVMRKGDIAYVMQDARVRTEAEYVGEFRKHGAVLRKKLITNTFATRLISLGESLTQLYANATRKRSIAFYSPQYTPFAMLLPSMILIMTAKFLDTLPVTSREPVASAIFLFQKELRRENRPDFQEDSTGRAVPQPYPPTARYHRGSAASLRRRLFIVSSNRRDHSERWGPLCQKMAGTIV